MLLLRDSGGTAQEVNAKQEISARLCTVGRRAKDWGKLSLNYRVDERGMPGQQNAYFAPRHVAVMSNGSRREASQRISGWDDELIIPELAEKHRAVMNEMKILVVGMPNVGKSSLLNALRRVGVHKGKSTSAQLTSIH